MKILVTGNLGYLGKMLTPMLFADGHQIEGCDLGLYERPGQGVTGPYQDVRSHWINDDIEAVIHLAAIVGEPACNDHRELAFDVNINGTRNLLSQARGRGLPFIFASTCSVYGAGDYVLFEGSRVKPQGPYAHDRLLAESEVIEQGGVALRFGTLFGWSTRMRFDLVINRWAGLAAQSKPLIVHGGKQWRPFCHVLDAARAVIRALERGEPGCIYNVAAFNFTLLEAANSIRKATNCAVEVQTGVEDQRNYRVNSDRARIGLGWEHQFGLVDGICKTISLSEKLDLEAPYYSNQASLQDPKPA